MGRTLISKAVLISCFAIFCFDSSISDTICRENTDSCMACDTQEIDLVCSEDKIITSLEVVAFYAPRSMISSCDSHATCHSNNTASSLVAACLQHESSTCKLQISNNHMSPARLVRADGCAPFDPFDAYRIIKAEATFLCGYHTIHCTPDTSLDDCMGCENDQIMLVCPSNQVIVALEVISFYAPASATSSCAVNATCRSNNTARSLVAACLDSRQSSCAIHVSNFYMPPAGLTPEDECPFDQIYTILRAQAQFSCGYVQTSEPSSSQATVPVSSSDTSQDSNDSHRELVPLPILIAIIALSALVLLIVLAILGFCMWRRNCYQSSEERRVIFQPSKHSNVVNEPQNVLMYSNESSFSEARSV